jgi:hypothetical protein
MMVTISRVGAIRFATVLMLTAACLWAGYAYSTRKPPSPLVVTRGGTYRGEWRSDDASVPVVVVATREPVVIENSTLRGRGHLVVSNTRHADITIRNTRGYSENPDVAGRCAGRFANIERFDRVVIENCYLEGTAGIYLLDYLGDGTEKNSVRIVRNRAKNIDGRKSDGNGGYLAEEPHLVQFAQFDKVRHVRGVEIAWNEVINEPGRSAVEDNISIYLSSGTKNSPLRIHDNFIRGAFPVDAARGAYSGGGIMLGDGVGDSADDDSAFVLATDNQVLDTVNYGIAISAGHDNAFERNRILSIGVLPDKTPIAAQNTGAYVWDSYRAGKGHFFNNGGRENVIGWVKDGERNDWWTPDAAAWEKNAARREPLTPATYEEEWRRWRDKLQSSHIVIGPGESVSTRPATSPAPAAEN